MAGTAPLAGLLVADFSRVVAGPYVSLSLSDLGADVIKVERPVTGDDTRTWGPPWVPGAGEQTSTYYQSINRSKRSMTLDLTDPDDLTLAQRLAARADVLVENFTVGTMERFGLDHRSLQLGNPGLVYCSVIGFGTTDEARDLPGYDLLAQAASGLMDITGAADGPPTKVGVAVVDILTALHATIGVLAALEERHRTGHGRHVTVSLYDAAMATLLNQGSAWLSAGSLGHRRGNDHPSIAPYSAYRARDRELIIACGNEGQFAKLAAVLGRADLAVDERFATNADRVEHRAELTAALESALAAEDAATWEERLRQVGVPAGPINTIAEAFQLGVDLGLEPIIDAGGVPTVRSPIRFDGGTGVTPTRPPVLGEHDAELRAWLASD